jgi:HEAT repeat protein
MRRIGKLFDTIILALGGCAALAASSAEVDRLAAALGAEDPRHRRWAAWSLGRMGEAAAPAAPALVVALDSDDALTRGYATDALVAIGPAAVDDLAAVLTRGPRVRAHAEDALSRMSAASVPPILEALETATDPRTRRSAATALGSIGPSAAAAIPALSRALATEESRSVGVALAWALGRIGGEALPALVAILDAGPPPDTRDHVIRALGEMGPAARPAADRVIAAAVADPERRVRSRAVLAVAAIGRDDAVAVLEQRLRDEPSDIVRGDVALALGQASAGSPVAVATLVEALGDPDVSAKAAMGLGAIGEPAYAAVLDALHHERPEMRAAAAEALRYLPAASESAVPRLVDAFADPDENVRRSASVTLQLVGEDAVEPLLLALDERPESEVRGWAALTLGNIEPPPGSAVPGLVAALDDDAPRVRELASWSLGRIGELAAEAVPRLTRALADENPVLRRNAAWALGNVGPAAAPAEAALEARLDDPEPDVVTEVREALEKIRGQYAYPEEDGS